jgi:cytoskeletal protein CcmA (bactofilin family)
MWGQEKQEGKQTAMNEEERDVEATAVVSGESAEAISAFVGKGVEFKGTITYSGTVRIDGLLDGEIHTDGVLLIGEEAVIQAKVTAGTIVCKGKITGDVVAKDRLKLRAPAVINGSVKTPMLSMEDGVLFNGGLEMNQGVRELTQGTMLQSVGMVSSPGAKRING